MDDIKLKSYTLKYNPEDPDDIFGIPNPKTDYDCASGKRRINPSVGLLRWYVISTGFDYIHKIVLKTRKYPDDPNDPDDPNEPNEPNEPISFSEEGLDILKEYLDKFPEKINCQNKEGYTALHLACRNSNSFSTERTVEFLLVNPDININLQNRKGETALHLACRNSKIFSTERTIEILLDHPDININLQDGKGETILHDACKYNEIKIVKMLLEYKTI